MAFRKKIDPIQLLQCNKAKTLRVGAETVHIDDIPVGENDFDKLISALANNTSLKQVDFFYFFEGKLGELLLLKILKNKNLITLRINNYEMENHGKTERLNLKIILDYLQKNKCLKELSFSHKYKEFRSTLSLSEIQAFATVIKTHPTLEIFDISKIDIKDTEIKAIDASEIARLQVLDVLRTEFKDKSIKLGVERHFVTCLDEKSTADSKEEIKKHILFLLNILNTCNNKKHMIKETDLNQEPDPNLLEHLSDKPAIRICKTLKDNLKTIMNPPEDESVPIVKFTIEEFKNVSALKIYEYKIEDLKSPSGYNIILYFSLTGSKEEGLKKYYYLVKNTPEIEASLNRLKEIMPGRLIERPTPKSHRLTQNKITLDFWDTNWESFGVFCHYHFENDLLVMNSLLENIQFTANENGDAKESLLPKKITVVDIGAGRGRLAKKIITKLIGMSFNVDYYHIDQSTVECKQAEKIFLELKKTYGDQFSYQIINTQFQMADLKKLNGKVDVEIASGYFTTPVTDRREGQADRDLVKASQLLADDGVMIITGAHPISFTKKEFTTKFGLFVDRATRKVTANGQNRIEQCYVLKKDKTILTKPDLTRFSQPS